MEFVETTEEIGDRIRRQLARIESHPLFVRSLRMRRFLEFTIERSLAGKADELKEYVLGVEVFDRPPAMIRGSTPSCASKRGVCVPSCATFTSPKGPRRSW